MMALAYSFAGSVLCLAGNAFFCEKIIDKNHIWIASVFGAVLHNIGRITVAVLVMGNGRAGLSSVPDSVWMPLRGLYRRLCAVGNT